MMKPHRCPTCGQVEKRNNEQNKKYWALINEITDKLKPNGHAYSADSWHLYFKQRFIGQDDIRLPNGKVCTQPKSTVDLDKTEMSDYITQVEQFADKYGVFSEE
jgi:hypothetical protein